MNKKIKTKLWLYRTDPDELGAVIEIEAWKITIAQRNRSDPK